MMARSNDPRLNNPRYLEQENVSLLKDVEHLEDALMLHARIQDETGGNVRNLLRKEIGGPLWQRGAEGRIHGYCSAKDLTNHTLPRPNPKTNCSGIRRQMTVTEETRGGIDDGDYLTAKHLTDRAKDKGRTGVKSNSAGTKRCTRTIDDSRNGIINDKISVDGLMKDVDIVGRSILSAKPARRSDVLLAPLYRSTMTSSGESLYQDEALFFADDCERLPMSCDPESSSFAESSDGIQRRNIDGGVRRAKYGKSKQQVFKKAQGKYDVQMTVNDFDVDGAACDTDVLQWLRGLQLRDNNKYARLFTEHELDMSSLRLLTRTQLQQMGIIALGPLNKMVIAIRELRQHSWRQRATSLNYGWGTSRESSSEMTDRRHSGYNTDYPIESDAASYRVPQKPKTAQNGVTRKPVSLRPGAPKVIAAPPSVWNATSGTVKQKAGKGSGSGRSSSSPCESAGSSRKTEGESNYSDSLEDGATEGDLLNLISVSGIQKQCRKTDKRDTPADIQTARESCRKAEKRLETLEVEIQTLQKDKGNPMSLTRINDLQLQLQHIQQQMTQCNQQTPQTDIANNGQLQNSPSQPAPPSPLAVTENILQPTSPDNARVNSARKGKTNGTGPSEKIGVGKTVSMSMTKSELLHEVRKQKQEHRRHIRHLQSEVTRLKVSDPLRNCEVVKEDIIFDEEAVIGEGAFSDVFRGFFQGSEVALKRLKVPLQVQDQNYFIAEVSLLRDLRHPRVVLLLGVCTSSSLPIMVLEYMSQGSLYHYLHYPDNPSLDHAAFYQIARDMALGMNYLHRHRPAVLHLDLKSTNVLLNDNLRAKIADFGFSKLRHDADLAAKKYKNQGHMKGTPAWMAPELFDHGEITPKADVYSFAVILWEMVTGTLPYEGCSVFQVIERVRKNKRPKIPNEDSCPEGLHRLIERCWAQRSSMRPHFKSILESLDELLFPPEWRSLFTAAGLPDSTLDDVGSTRILISLVSQVMEPQGDRPCGVPPLQLSDNDSDDECSSRGKNSGSPTHAGAKSTPMKMVTESMSQEAVDEMDFMYVDTNRTGDAPQGLSSLVPQIDVSAEALAMPAASTCFDAPPAPPPLLTFDTSRVKPKVSPKPTKLKPAPSVVRESFLDELKAGLNNLNQRPRKVENNTDDEALKCHPVKGRQMADIRQSMLLNQRGRLKPTVNPHPNQLHNLKDIGKEQLNSLTEIIRKAIAQRRTAMQDGIASLDESPFNSKWSITDDWPHG